MRRKSGALALLTTVACAKGGGVGDSTASGPGPGDTTGLPPTTTAMPTTFDSISATLMPTSGTGSSSGIVDSSSSGVADSSSTGMGPFCGNNQIDGVDLCDGADLGGVVCSDVDMMFTGGDLFCNAACDDYDTSQCITTPNPFQVCETVNIAIPDAGLGIGDTIAVPPGGDVMDIEIDVDITHTWIGDLTIDVTHGLTTVRLYDETCSGEPDIDVTFDDQAVSFIDCMASATGASYQPFQPLNSFSGDPMEGDWMIFVQDNIAADLGTLVEWCVTITWE